MEIYKKNTYFVKIFVIIGDFDLNNKSLSKNYVFNLISQFLTIITPLITTPYVSRVLGADGIGEYSYVYSFVSYFSMFGMLGIATYGQLIIAQVRDEKKRLSKTFWEVYVAQCTSMLLSILLYFLLLVYGNFVYKNMLFALVIMLFAQLFDITWFFQGIENFKGIVLKNLVIKLLGTILIFILVKSKKDLYIYAVILQGSTFLGNLSLWKYIFKTISFVPLKNIKFWKHWKGCMLFFIPTIATSVYTVLDKSMVGIITGSTLQNGYYEQAHKIEQIMATIVTAISTVILPRIAYLNSIGNYTQIRKIQQMSFEFILFSSFPLSFGLAAIAPNLIPVFLGEGYDACIPILQIFCLLIILLGLDNLIGKQYLMAQNKQNYFNIGVIIGAFINFLFNCFMIKIWGSLGAAISSVVAELSILIVFIFFTKCDVDYKWICQKSFKYIFASLLMGISVFFMGKTVPQNICGILIQIMSGAVIYALLMFLAKDKPFILILTKIKSHLRR